MTEQSFPAVQFIVFCDPITVINLSENKIKACMQVQKTLGKGYIKILEDWPTCPLSDESGHIKIITSANIMLSDSDCWTLTICHK